MNGTYYYLFNCDSASIEEGTAKANDVMKIFGSVKSTEMIKEIRELGQTLKS